MNTEREFATGLEEGGLSEDDYAALAGRLTQMVDAERAKGRVMLEALEEILHAHEAGTSGVDGERGFKLARAAIAKARGAR